MHHFVYRHALTNNNGHKQRSNLKSKLVHIARLAPSAKKRLRQRYSISIDFALTSNWLEEVTRAAFN